MIIMYRCKGKLRMLSWAWSADIYRNKGWFSIRVYRWRNVLETMEYGELDAIATVLDTVGFTGSE